MASLFVKVIRKKTSYDFKINPGREGFDNNIKNNCIDVLILCVDNKEIFRASVQTVSNYPFCNHQDTIAPGKFQIKAFVPKRQYDDFIHGICNAVDLEGQKINHSSMQLQANGEWTGRWLVHSTLWRGKVAKYAYSQGCIMFQHPQDLVAFNHFILDHGIKKDDLIDAVLVEEE